MRLRNHVRQEWVLVDPALQGAESLLESLVELVCRLQPGPDRDQVLRRLLERGQATQSGLENGVAVPHATAPGLTEPVCAVARLSQPVDFGAVDGRPVRLVFLLLSPEGAISSHIRLLARIARLCSRQEFIDALLAAPDAPAFFQVLVQEDERHV